MGLVNGGFRSDFRSIFSGAISVIVAACLVCLTSLPLAYGEEETRQKVSFDQNLATSIDPLLDYSENEMLVVYDDAGQAGVSTFSLESDSGVEDALDTLGIQVKEEVAEPTQDTGSVVLVEVPESLSFDDAIAQLSAIPGIASVQPNYQYMLVDSWDVGAVEEGAAGANEAVVSSDGLSAYVVPDDPYCTDENAPSPNQYYLYNSKVIDAWSQTQCNGSVTVAVLDTGCRLDHEDLIGTVDSVHAYDAYSGKLLSERVDINGDASGHGTHVTGIIAAQAGNGVGVAGASYNATVLPVKVFSDGAASPTASTSAIVAGYRYLKDLIDAGSVDNLHVINMSLGGYPASLENTDPLLNDAIDTMRDDYNVLTVCAGGNGDDSGNPITAYSYPSDYESCLAVTSLDRDGANSYWSDYNEYKDISAPGEGICSAGISSTSAYAFKSGTSMASPLVAGSAALLWAANPNLTVSEAVTALESTAHEIVDTKNDRRAISGSTGSLDAAEAVRVVSSSSGDDPEPASEVANASNFVVLVNFSDTTGVAKEGYNAVYPYASESNGIRTKWDYFKARFNEKNMAYSTTFRDYLFTVSNGKHDVETIFPQDNGDGTLAYITLDRPCSYYSAYDAQGNDHYLIHDTLEKLNETYPDLDTSKIDLNSDGYVDNLLVVPTVTSGETFTSHKAVLDDSEATVGISNPENIYAYNIIETSFNEDSPGFISDTFNFETAAHEYLHSLGAPDLYRLNGDGSPVGIWDIMAATGGRSWPLAVTRQQLGWTTISDKTGVESCTLYAPGSGNEQAVILKSPLNDSEYFVVEYRQKPSGTEAVTACDRLIGGSGLIVYRVNPAYSEEGNAAGNDFVYVFRQGETSLTASAGDVMNAQVGMANYGAPRQSIGTADMTADITQGALCYSDGQNSGISIQVSQQTDESIAFTLTYPNYAEAELWDSVTNEDGTIPEFGSNIDDVQIVVDGQTLYALIETWDDISGITSYCAMKYDGQNWFDLGLIGEGLSNGQLAVKDGRAYFVASDYTGADSGVVLMYWNGGDSWTEAARLRMESSYVNAPALGFVGSSVYVSVDNDYKNVGLYRLEGLSLVSVSDSIPVDSIVSPAVFELGGYPAVACGDSESGVGKSLVLELVDGSWVTCAESVGFSHYNSVAKVGSSSYVFQHKDLGDISYLTVLGSDGATLQTVELPQFGSSVHDGSLSAEDGFLYLSIVEGQGSSAVTKTYSAAIGDLTNWTQLGSDVYRPGDSASSAVLNGKVVVASRNAIAGTATVRAHVSLGRANESALVISAPTVPELTYGYSNAMTLSFVVQNNGTRTVDGLSVELVAGVNAFQVGSLSQTTLDPGETATVSCVANPGLDAGSYSATIVVSNRDATVSCSRTIDQTVGKLDISSGLLYESGSALAGVSSKIYNSNPQTLESGWRVKVGVVWLGQDEISLSYRNNVNGASSVGLVAPVVMVFTKSGNLTGSFEVKFSIEYTQVLASDTYVIQSALSNNMVLDISGGSKGNSANAQLYSSNMTSAQRFSVSFDKYTGYYTFTNVNSGKVLDVAGGNASSGTNVAQYQSNGTKAQKWIVSKRTDGAYRITSALRSDLVLDVAGACANNGTNVQVWVSNNTTAQAFKFLPLSPQVSGGETVSSGTYVIKSSLGGDYAIDISGASKDNGANAQLWSCNGTDAQRYRITYGVDGYYSIVCVASGKALDVDAGNLVPGTNVQQWMYSADNNNQRWAIRANTDGTYAFIAKSNGLAIDVQWGNASRGANIWTYGYNGSAAQKFVLVRS